MSTGSDSTNRVGTGQMAAIYTRTPVGSDRDRTTPERQWEMCEELAVDLGYDTSEELVFTDSGPPTSDTRPGLMALIRALAEGRASAVIVDRQAARYHPRAAPQATHTGIRREDAPRL
ncbi:hypothetical protein Tter_1148 [Thermobaculum terrenum ATCC BAA-798]|uniref:Resolvase/invertase-type recombinase catalytic domain-containing protein n=1 Tax=Thermobaculum terrenum (strain ATCC BAA-798 / CCMEE 7001 / YNP1) TaxID=525904 RepID=D1CB95_THET1|nr:recombinase family protein [Thermobaculum terrenum]ACZ42060.1 hypothetical protein Tter_1148 [Thermobaculum terrenum ATCC BAA-798]